MARILFMLPLLAALLPDAVAAGAAVPDQDVSERPIAGPPLWPIADLPRWRHLSVVVECTVTVEGLTKDCTVVDRFGPLAIADAALEYVSHSRYTPASSNGVFIETRHRWTIRIPPVDK